MQGDALFFHCNLLHCSSANMSTARRWAFLCAYNRADNDPVIKHHHPNYTPLQKVSCYTYVIRRKTKHCFAPIALKMVWFKNYIFCVNSGVNCSIPFGLRSKGEGGLWYAFL